MHNLIRSRIGTARANEDGFSLTEVLVVMFIMVAIMAFTISTFNGSRKASKHQQLLLAASAYAKAADSYRLDNGGRVPTAGTAWPSSAAAKGPVDILANPVRNYLRAGIPEGVGTVIQLTAVGATVGPSTAQYKITYTTSGTTTYTVTATDTVLGKTCTFTNGGTSTC
jgi:prepilin-type N-terminal cleavage/methylation domain-containing protein